MRGKEAFPALSGVIAPGQLKVVLSELLDRMSRAGVPDGDSVYATLAQIPPSVMLTAGIQRHTSRGSTGYCGNEEELLGVLGQFEGQPTATLHFLEADAHLARRLLKVLEGKDRKSVV